MLILLFISLKKIKDDFKHIKSNDFLIIISLIASSFVFIFHQLMTVNGMFIFFIIPILGAFAHIYFLDEYKNRNYILYSIIILTICSSIHYTYKYIPNFYNF